MKIIDIIEKYCGCKVQEISAYQKGTVRTLYVCAQAMGETFTRNFTDGVSGGTIVFTAEKLPSQERLTLMDDLALCLSVSGEYIPFNESFPLPADMGSEQSTLEDIISQTLDTLVYSGFFDNAAVMFFNEKSGELRGVDIASAGRKSGANPQDIKNIRISAKKEELLKHKDEPMVTADKIFASAYGITLKNKVITAVMTAGGKVYGTLALYSENPYDSRHLNAAQSTARFISAMISALLVYNKYKYSLNSEKQLAEQIKNNEALITLGNYAATLAHEIKNPLISIGGFAKRIKKAVEDPDLQKMANIISTESERLERLTEDILSYSKKHEPIKQPINLLEEIENIKMLFENRSKESRIDIKTDIDPAISVSVDKNQFRQVVVNLVANAMNAIEKNGAVNISCNAHSSFHNLIIADTGSGIPESNLTKLFKPFFTTSKNGTGLGLAISKKIMINHGGDIVAKNGTSGAEFTLIIPK